MSINKRIDRLWYIHTLGHSALQLSECLAKTWMNLKNIMLNERSHTSKSRKCTISLTWRPFKNRQNSFVWEVTTYPCVLQEMGMGLSQRRQPELSPTGTIWSLIRSGFAGQRVCSASENTAKPRSIVDAPVTLAPAEGEQPPIRGSTPYLLSF